MLPNRISLKNYDNHKKGKAMKKSKINGLQLVVSLLLILMIMSGCSHYRVTDPSTGNEYYTKDYKQLPGGAVKLTDEKTQRTVTVVNSEIEKISDGEYKDGLRGEKVSEEVEKVEEAVDAEKVETPEKAKEAEAPEKADGESK